MGVAVVESHEFACTEGAFKISPGNTEVAVADGTGGEHHGVVVGAEFVDGDVASDGDVGQQPHLRLVQYVVQGFHDAFDARMIGRYTVPDQPKWRWHLFKQVNAHVSCRFDQQVRSVNTCGTRANDGDVKGLCHGCSAFRVGEIVLCSVVRALRRLGGSGGSVGIAVAAMPGVRDMWLVT